MKKFPETSKFGRIDRDERAEQVVRESADRDNGDEFRGHLGRQLAGGISVQLIMASRGFETCSSAV